MSEQRSRSKKGHKKKQKRKRNSRNTVSSVITRVGIRLVICALLIFVFVQAGTSAYRFGYRIFTTGAMEEEPGTDVIITIQEDMTALQIGELLENKGLIEDSLIFVIQNKIYTNSSYYIQPGTYTLNTSMTMEELIETMADEPAEEEEETTALASGDTENTEDSDSDAGTEDSGEDQTDE